MWMLGVDVEIKYDELCYDWKIHDQGQGWLYDSINCNYWMLLLYMIMELRIILLLMQRLIGLTTSTLNKSSSARLRTTTKHRYLLNLCIPRPSHQFIGRPWKLPAGQALTLDFW